MTSTIVPIPTGGVIRDCHDGQTSLTEIAVRVFEAIADGAVPLPTGGIDFNERITRVSVVVDSMDDLRAWADWLGSDIVSAPIADSDNWHHVAEDQRDVVAYWIQDGAR